MIKFKFCPFGQKWLATKSLLSSNNWVIKLLNYKFECFQQINTASQEKAHTFDIAFCIEQNTFLFFFEIKTHTLRVLPRS